MPSLSISLVTPTLNAGPYLREALESVAAQRHQDLEVIVADGGSTDESLEIAHRFSYVTVLPGPDAGIYDGMNRGLRHAGGEIVGILNADDRLAEGTLNKVVEVFTADLELDVITGGFLVFGSQGQLARLLPGSRILSFEGLVFGVPGINARFFRRRLLDQIGFFDQEIGLAADRELLVRLLRRNPKRATIDTVLYHYRAHAGSHTLAGDRRARTRVWQSHFQLAKQMMNHPATCPHERRVWRLLQSLEGAKLIASRARGGKAGEAISIARTLFGENHAWLADLPAALVAWRRWRGQHSGA